MELDHIVYMKVFNTFDENEGIEIATTMTQSWACDKCAFSSWLSAFPAALAMIIAV